MDKVRVRVEAETASGRRKGWFKVVDQLDTTKKGGYCLLGKFLGDGELVEVPVGAPVVEVYPCGSVKNGYKEARVWRTVASDDPEKAMELVLDSTLWREDFLKIRDAVEAVLNEAVTPRDSDAFLDMLRASVTGSMNDLKEAQSVLECQGIEEMQAAESLIQQGIDSCRKMLAGIDEISDATEGDDDV